MSKNTDSSSPRGEFLLGHARLFLRDPLNFLLETAKKYGGFVTLRMAHLELYLISKPQYIEEILATRQSLFQKDPTGSKVAGEISGEKNIVSTPSGEEHKRKRRLMQPSFHNRRMPFYVQAMTEEIDDLLKPWKAGQTRDIHWEMVNLTMHIAVRIFFGTKLKEDAERVGRAFNFMQGNLHKKFKRGFGIPRFIPTPGNLKFKKEYKYIRTLAGQIIAAKQEEGVSEKSEDLLSTLLSVRDENGSSMDIEEIIDDVMILFFAGHETTANALAWFWDQMAAHPEIESRVYKEIDSVIGKREPSYDDLEKLPYTLQVLKETLRYRPPAWMLTGRMALEEVDLDGHTLKPGVRILISPFVVHHLPEYFPEPDRFDPDRFTKENEKKIPRGAYIPFGLGARVCIGEGFAIVEALLAIAKIASGYRLVREEGLGEAKVEAALTLSPEGGLPLRLEKR